jgi:hypothetical protein
MKDIRTRGRTARIHRGALSLAAALACCVVAVIARAESGWETIRVEDGIVVSRQDVPGSPFVALRGEGDINAPLVSVASVLVDVPHQKDWMDDVVEARILRQVSATEYIVYSHLGTPPTMSDRDVVVDATLTVDAPKRTVTVSMHSVTDPSAPKTDYIRADLRESRFVLSPSADGKRTHLVVEMHADPKGSIAAWIVNLFQKNWGYNTISNLRRRITNPSLEINAPLRQYLEFSGFPLQATRR